ncbi:MAG TPA: hypothetical protein PK133_09355 [Ferruginibacter sp.]|nr:hypothetical protein [Ferruginibacter sp.]
MKQLIFGLAALLLVASCRENSKPIVSAEFVDSLLTNYTEPEMIRSIKTDLQFWKSRIDPKNPGLLNELRYASTLVQRFHHSGDIQDIIAADSILKKADGTYDHKESAPNMALVRNSILQHRFKQADSLLAEAKKADVKPYDAIAASFDVAFESGQYLLAETELKKIADYNDYGYNFRYARLAHYKGEPDSALAAMHRASAIAGMNIMLKQAALSNEADLNLHTGNLQRANELYMRSIRLNAADLHSLMGLGWMALVYDKNDPLAEKIFRFVQSKTKTPDMLFKLSQLADARGDRAMQKKYAQQYADAVTAPAYGNMYNRYMIELYTGILNEPAKAEALAIKELLNRATPQTYAWYVWALYCNNKTAEAVKIYQQYVSGKPLEAPELYWMGRFMQGERKGYNAQQYFKAAYKNRYDLGPSMLRYLEEALED